MRFDVWGVDCGFGPAGGAVGRKLENHATAEERDSSGTIYAPAQYGGHKSGVCQSIGSCGVIFKETPNATGGFTTGIAYNFTGGTDGYAPASKLTLDSSGNLYGAGAGKPSNDS
jgi:hypothetical protein